MAEEGRGDTADSPLNPNKIDLFNIGLVMLSAIVLQDCYYIYNRNQFSINSERFASYKEQLHEGSRYSPILINWVESFLVLHPDLRKTPNHYYKVLEKFEDNILGLQDFEKESLSHIEDSPQVVNYLEKVSPNTKETKFLSLARKTKAKETGKEGSPVEPSSEYQPMKVTRKLFSEEAKLPTP